MKLSDKIFYCRKKAGLSQEELADKIGVSRQAISKWETGEAAPEIGKLAALARAFDVTADWLLSTGDPEPDKAAPQQSAGAVESPPREGASWVDSIPGAIGRLIRRYGWLYGVYTALAGLGFAAIGALARAIARQIFGPSSIFGGGFDPSSPIGGYGSNTIWYNEAGEVISNPFGSQVSSFAQNNPVSIMGAGLIAVGIVMIIAGVILAIYLKNKSGDEAK